jgi:hypothetical protein
VPLVPAGAAAGAVAQAVPVRQGGMIVNGCSQLFPGVPRPPGTAPRRYAIPARISVYAAQRRRTGIGPASAAAQRSPVLKTGGTTRCPDASASTLLPLSSRPGSPGRPRAGLQPRRQLRPGPRAASGPPRDPARQRARHRRHPATRRRRMVIRLMPSAHPRIQLLSSKWHYPLGYAEGTCVLTSK